MFYGWKSQVKSKNIIVRILIFPIFLLFVTLYSIQTVFVVFFVVFWQLLHSNLSIMAHLVIVFILAIFDIYPVIMHGGLYFLLILILIPVDFLLIALFLVSLYLQLLSFGRQYIILVCLFYI